jgi:hypothetical protein
MTSDGWLQIALFTIVVAVTVRPLGGYIRAFSPARRLCSGAPWVRSSEEYTGLPGSIGRPSRNGTCTRWRCSLNSVGVGALYTLQRLLGCYPSTRSTSMR